MIRTMLNVSLNNHSRKRDRDNHDFLKNQIMLDMKLFKNVFWNLRNKFLGFPMIEYTIFKIRENGEISSPDRHEDCSDMHLRLS
mgnify:CR=1 FL=1